MLIRLFREGFFQPLYQSSDITSNRVNTIFNTLIHWFCAGWRFHLKLSWAELIGMSFCVKCYYIHRNSHPEVFLEKGVLKICSKFTGEHPCRSVISIKLLCSALQLYKNHTSAWVFSCFFIQYILPLPILNKVIMKIIKWHLVKKFTGEYPIFFEHLR